MRGGLTHHGGPFADDPTGDQTARDVWIVLRELLDDGFRRRGKEQDGSVDGIRERAGQNQLATRLGRARVTEMGTAESGTLFENVGDIRIKEEIVHARDRSGGKPQMGIRGSTRSMPA